MAFDGTVLTEKTQAIDVPALSSKVYLQLPISEFLLLKGFDPAKTFIVTELAVGGTAVSSNLLFLLSPKNLQLPVPKISSELTQSGNSYHLRLASDVLARDVYVSFSNLDATYSDNYVSILPGQTVEIDVKSAGSLDQLRSGLKIVSLTDAFAQVAPASAGVQ
jgi:beta-mannosidase